MEETMSYTVVLRRRVESAARGELNEDERKALADEVIGAFQSFPVIGRGIVSLASQQNWNALIGALGNYIDTQRIGVASTSITNNAVSSASVSIDLRVVYEAEDAIREDASISSQEKTEIIRLLREVVSAAQRKDAPTAADRLRQLLEDGANAVTLITWLGPILVQVGMMLANGS